MDWNSIKETVSSPLFITIAVCIAVVLIILIVFANTTVGKKVINKLLNVTIPDVKKGITLLSVKVDQVKEEGKELKTANENFQKELDNKFNVYLSQLEFFEVSIYQILSLIPNEKVKAAVESFKSQLKEKKREIKELVGLSYTEIEEQLKARDVQIDRLSDELKKVKELLNETVKVEGDPIYVEGNEGTHD